MVWAWIDGELRSTDTETDTTGHGDMSISKKLRYEYVVFF